MPLLNGVVIFEKFWSVSYISIYEIILTSKHKHTKLYIMSDNP